MTNNNKNEEWLIAGANACSKKTTENKEERKQNEITS